MVINNLSYLLPSYIMLNIDLDEVKHSGDSDDSVTQDGYIGKPYKTTSSSQDSDKDFEDIDPVTLSEVKQAVIASFNTEMVHEKQFLQQEIDNAMQRMTTNVENLVEKATLSGASLLGISKMKKIKPIFSEKVFEQRDSLLTESTQKGKEAHTVFNIFVAILILIFLKLIMHDVFSKGYYFIDMTLLFNLARDLQLFWVYWIPNFVFSFIIVVFVNVIIKFKLSHHVYLPIYILIIIIAYAFPIYAALALSDSVLIGMILTCEMVRLSMKMHAYFREKLLH
jgi:hypothetical protein